jgi:hypothetical protein
MEGYNYNTEEDAILARKKCADFYGLPKTESNITKYWVDFQYSELDNFWYIIFDESIREILGEPITIEITENNDLDKEN